MYYDENKSKIKHLFDDMQEKFEANGWTLVAREKPNEFSGEGPDILVVKTIVDVPSEDGGTVQQDRVLAMKRDAKDYHGFDVQMCESWDPTNDAPGPGKVLASAVSRVDFFPYLKFTRELYIDKGQNTSSPSDDTPRERIVSSPFNIAGLSDEIVVYWYMDVKPDRVVVVFEGDPALGLDYSQRVSWMYAGKIIPFNEDDIEGNFALTCGANFQGYDDEKQEETGFTRDLTWGDYTGNGMNDIIMWKTSSGLPFQEHHPSIVTHTSKARISRFNESNWTRKYYMSPIYVVHGEDGFRGYLDGVLAVHNESIVNRDELLVKESDGQGGTIEKRYKYFTVNTDKSIVKDMANDKVGIAIYEDPGTEN